MTQVTETDNADQEPRVIAVFGLGYVGCVTAASLAQLGHRVIGVERDARKVASVQAGEAPFYEPKLNELVREAVGSVRLTATEDADEALAGAQIAMICVGTMGCADGRVDPSHLDAVSASIAASAKRRGRPLIVAVRSTVLPGMCETIIQPHFDIASRVTFVSNPEFLREGEAVDDFFHPALVVVGGEDAASVGAIAGLYRTLGVAPVITQLRSAEMIKYAYNALNAVKIDFANEIGRFCESMEINAAQVMGVVSKGQRKDGSAYLRPGFAFGGSCLGKDLRALLSRAHERGVELPLLEAALPSNDRHLDSAAERLLSGGGTRIGVFGLAFKAGTDDVRESPSVRLIARLIAGGSSVRAYDPCVDISRIYGSNLEWLRSAIPSMDEIVTGSVDKLLEWSDRIVLIHQPSEELLARIVETEIPVSRLDRLGRSSQQKLLVLN